MCMFVQRLLRSWLWSHWTFSNQQWIHDFFLLHILGQTLQSVCFLLFVATAPTKLPGPLKIQFFLFNEKFIWLANVFDFFNLKKNYTINKSQPNKVTRAPEDKICYPLPRQRLPLPRHHQPSSKQTFQHNPPGHSQTSFRQCQTMP